MVEPLSLNFREFTVKLVGVPKFRKFGVFSTQKCFPNRNSLVRITDLAQYFTVKEP